MKAADVYFRLLQMGLERLLQLLVGGMFDHARKTLDDLVLRREEIAQLKGVQRLKVFDVVWCKETHIDSSEDVSDIPSVRGRGGCAVSGHLTRTSTGETAIC